MNQSTIIAGAIVLGYIVFITLRGELPCYLKVLGIGSGGSNCPANNPQSTAAQYLTPTGISSTSITTTSGGGIGVGGGNGCVTIGVKVPGTSGTGVGVSFPLPVFCGGGSSGGGSTTPPVISGGGGGGGL
jgi:hypothetical protein